MRIADTMAARTGTKIHTGEKCTTAHAAATASARTQKKSVVRSVNSAPQFTNGRLATARIVWSSAVVCSGP